MGTKAAFHPPLMPSALDALPSATLVRLLSVLSHTTRDRGADDDELSRRIDGLTDLNRFAAAAPFAGLRAFAVSVPLAQVQAHHLPLVAVDARGNVVVVVGAARRTLTVHELDGTAHKLSRAALAARLGVDVDASVAFSSVEPVRPLAAIAAGGQGHHDHHPSAGARVASLIALDRVDVVVVVVYAAVVALLSLATPLTVQALVSSVAFGNLLQPLLVLSGVLVVALLFMGALRTLQLYVVEVLQRRLFMRLVADLAWRLPRLSHEALSEKDGSKLVNRFFDVLTVQKSSAKLLLDGVVLVLELCVGLTVLALYSNALLLFSVFLLAAIAFIVFVLGRGGVTTSVTESYAKHDVAGWLEDLVRHPTAFRDRFARALGVGRADAFAHRYLAARQAHFRVLLRQNVAGFALQAFSASLLLGVGGALVIRGQLTLGQLVAAELIVGVIVGAIAKLAKQLETAYDLFAAVDKIGHLVDLPTEREGGVDVKAEGGVSVVVEGVSVAVCGGALTVPKLALRAGEQLALQGASGAGKSSVVDVVLGVRDVDAGRVVVDGDDLRELDLSSWRARVGLARGVEVFDGSVAENLRLGREGLRTRDLVEALKVVDLDDVIHAHADGLALHVVPTSSVLSSGQLARLMIARAVLGSPGLIVVDGAFDALEPALVKRLVPAVQRRAKKLGASLLVCTTRQDVAACFDRVATIADGVVDAADAPAKNADGGSR